MLRVKGLLGSLLGGTDPPDETANSKMAAQAERAATLLEQGLNLPNAPSGWKLLAAEVIEGLRAGVTAVRDAEGLGSAFVFTSLGSKHDLFKVDLEPVPLWPARNLTSIPDIIAGALDMGFLPDTDIEGRARVQVIQNWSVISFHDRSADRRAGSHSTFVFLGTFPGIDGIAEAQRLFPSVFARYPFEVILD